MPDIFGDLFTLSGFFTLLMLLLLQAVLGFDNLLYISIEAKRTGKSAPMVRRWGIGLAMLFRVVLLIIIVSLFGLLAEPLFAIEIPRVIDGKFTLQSLVTLGGGAFIIGPRVKGGLYAEYPSLNQADWENGEDLKHTIDFRGVYGTVLEQWLGVDPSPIVGGSFEQIHPFG